MIASKDEALPIIRGIDKVNSSGIPDALQAFLDNKPINRSIYIPAPGYPFDLEVHQSGDRFTIDARMGEDSHQLYSSHCLNCDRVDSHEPMWLRGDDIQISPRQYEAIKEFIGDICIDGPTIPTELMGWVSRNRSKPNFMYFWFADSSRQHHLQIDPIRHGDPEKIDKLISDHRFDELVALATGETNAHLNYPHHADLTNLSPRQIEDFILAEAACLEPSHELEPHQIQNILKDMSAQVLDSRGFKSDYGYQVASGNSVEPETNGFAARDTCTEEWRYPYLSANGWEELSSEAPLELEDLQLLVGIRGQRTTIECLTERFSDSNLEIVIDAGDHATPLEPYCLAPKTFEPLPGNILIVGWKEGRIVGVPKDEIEWYVSQICVSGDLPNSSVRKTIDYCREEVVKEWPEGLAIASDAGDVIGAEALTPELPPVDLGSTLDLIDVEFCEDTEYQEDGGCPYLADLQPVNMWTNPIDVEVYALPEGWTEAAFLAMGYTKVSAKLNGHQLYVPNHQVKDNLRYREIQLWYALHPELEVKEYMLDLEVDRTYHDYGEALSPQRLLLPQREWNCCSCNKQLGVDQIRSWGYKAHEYSTHADIYCPKCLEKHLEEGQKHQEYTIVDRGGNILYYHPYYDAFARSWRGHHREPDSIEAIHYFQGYLFCESEGVEIYSWLPWWQQPLRKLLFKFNGVEKQAQDHTRMWSGIGTPIGPFEYRIQGYGQEYVYRTYGIVADAERFINYVLHSALMFRQLHPEQCVKDALGVNEMGYLLSHYLNGTTESDAVETYRFDLEDTRYLDQHPEWIPCLYKRGYRPGLQQTIQNYLKTGELLEWSPFLDIGLEGTALEIQELGEKIHEKEEMASQLFSEDQSHEYIQQDLDNYLTVELIDVKGKPATRQIRTTIRDVIVDVNIGFESYRGDFESYYDADLSIIEGIAKDPRFKELVAISSGMIDYPYVKYPDFSNIKCLDSGDELKRFVESRAYKLGEEYGDSSIAGNLIDEINHCHAWEVDVSRYKIRNDAVKGIPFKPLKFRGGKIDQSDRLHEAYIRVGEIYTHDRTKNIELPIKIGSDVFNVAVGIETENGPTYHYGNSVEPIQAVTQSQKFKELVAATAGIRMYPYTHNLDFRHPENLTVEELQLIIEQRAKILGEEYGVPSMGVSLMASVGTICAVRRGTTKEGLLKSFIDPIQEAELEPVWDNPLM